MPHYALGNHVFVCLQGEHVVFLDVRKDRYFALEAAHTLELAALVRGWPISGTQADGAAPENPEPSTVLGLLLEKGLVTADGSSGKDATFASITPLNGELTAEASVDLPKMRAMELYRFISAALTASFILRFRSLDRVVERVRRRNLHRSAHAPPFHAERALQLVAQFASLRPFFFTAKDACLFEALALSEFLSAYGLFPNWVFGVQARPFAAHCWLQQHGFVFNDTVDHVGRFMPIMSV